MRRIGSALILAAVVGASGFAQAPQASPSTLAGRWKAEFVGPIGPRPKMVDDFMFAFTETPAGLSGTAKAEPNWPGDLDVSDLKVTGDTFSFVGTSHLGSSANGVPHCCPRLIFAGTVSRDTMTLTMTWTSTESPDNPNAQPVPMQAKRMQ